MVWVSGKRYSWEVKQEARWMRARGLGCKTIASELGVSLRSAQLWTADVRVDLVRECLHCGRAFTQPADAHGPRMYCTSACARYAHNDRRRAKRGLIRSSGAV